MPLSNALVHPLLFKSMPQFFPSRCTIYDVAEERNPIGERIPVPSDAMLPGTANPFLEGIPCAIGDSSRFQRRQISEERTADSEYNRVYLVIMLAGNYPSITEKMRAVVDGVTYNILATSLSPVTSHTELIVEVITL